MRRRSGIGSLIDRAVPFAARLSRVRTPKLGLGRRSAAHAPESRKDCVDIDWHPKHASRRQSLDCANADPMKLRLFFAVATLSFGLGTDSPAVAMLHAL